MVLPLRTSTPTHGLDVARLPVLRFSTRADPGRRLPCSTANGGNGRAPGRRRQAGIADFVRPGVAAATLLVGLWQSFPAR